MSTVRVGFTEMEWEERAPGCRVKVVHRAGKQIRLVEFGPEFAEPDWCVRGHSGLVLEGELHVNVDGEVVVFRAGDGIALPSGKETRHMHVPGSPRCVLFLVEDL
jgi:quercetin dioxygenase-like cupin family protein